ncbi:hypothetical protein JW905_04260, partial [bacterium]|nr:hypothetical protein [candidate division CSSED10-310 bacterium]
MMRTGLSATVLMGVLSVVVSAQGIVLYDLDHGAANSIGQALRTAAGLATITCVTALNIDGIEGDEWLLLAGDGRLVGLDLTDLSPVLEIDEQDLRYLFGLGIGTGDVASLCLPDDGHELLLYRDISGGSFHAVDFAAQTTGAYAGPSLPEGFCTGFSYTSAVDQGILNRDDFGLWYYRAILPGGFLGEPLMVNLGGLFGGVTWGLTEMETAGVHFLVAVMAENEPTPTPAPSVTPTAPPGGRYEAVIAMGNEWKLWSVDCQDFEVTPRRAPTGLSPNTLVARADHVYVVNSLSNSIGVYSVPDLEMEREIGFGPGRNPFAMAFKDEAHCYVTNFIANSVSLLRVTDGTVVAEIPLPAGAELPHDEGVVTYARPEGVAVVGGTCYVACANLQYEFVAGGPGIVCEIDAATDQLTGWFESGGRDTVSVDWEPRWPDWLWLTSAGDYQTSTGFVGNGQVSIWSISERCLVDQIPVGDAPFEIAFGSDRIYLASAMDGLVVRLDLADLSLLSPVPLPNAGHGVNFVSGLEIGP